MINTSTITELINLNKGKFNLLRVNSYYINKNYNSKLLKELDDLIKELKISKSILSKNLKLIENNDINDSVISNMNHDEDRICRVKLSENKVTEKMDSVVYLLHNTESNKLKIGTTQYINKRLSTIKSSAGCNVELLNLIKGDTKIEREIHSKFSKFRDIGEWFIYHESIINFFNNYNLPMNTTI
jgi:seryl-tRNA synthetase